MSIAEKTYKIPAGTRPADVVSLPPPCGCAPKVMLVISERTKSTRCGACGRFAVVELTLGPEGGTLVLRLQPPGEEPPAPAGVTADLNPKPPPKSAHAIPPSPEAPAQSGA